MKRQNALVIAFDNSDKNFFCQHLDRKAHIRLPFENECAGEFWQMGEHNRTRRRILLCRCDAQGQFLPEGRVMKIPFLLFADETVEDRDDILLPIIQEIMQGALLK